MKRGFTLVELLISIAVIAILTSIVIPSMHMVRARANSSRCLANLRALGISLNGYLSDNQMMMPTLEAARLSKTDEVPVIDNTLDRYVDSVAVFTCPAGKKIALDTGTSYYWNNALSGQSANSLNFFGFVTDLSKIPILVDKEGWHKYTDDKVNHLFADGHATNQLRLSVE